MHFGSQITDRTIYISLQQLNIVSPLQLLYHPQLVKEGEVRWHRGLSSFLCVNKLAAVLCCTVVLCALGMADRNLLSVLWTYWILFPVQHDISLSILSKAGRDALCWQDC